MINIELFYMKEIWKDIKGYESLYQISNLGRLKSLVYKNKEKIRKAWKAKKKKGKSYAITVLYKNGEKQTIKIHRIVAETFIPNPENKPYVNHIDGNKYNNRAENLEWVTHRENMQHAFKNNLYSSIFGEKNYKSKLKESEVKEIRRIYVKGHKQYGARPLGKKYRVSSTTIRQIIKYEIWKHI